MERVKRKFLSEKEDELMLDLSLSPYSLPSTTPSTPLASLPPPLRSGSYNQNSESPLSSFAPPTMIPPFTTILPPMMVPPPILEASKTKSPNTATARKYPASKTKNPNTTTARRYPTHLTGRTRRAPQSANSNDDKIPPPFPWATDKRAVIHSLEYLESQNIKKIKGEVQCKKCNARITYEFDLSEKFTQVKEYIINNKVIMHDRAPNRWLHPELPACNQCGQANSLKPVMPDTKEEINWLFLLLGEMLGECTLDQLKYFCMHTKNHRTGAKDRVLYLTFLALCKQLDPREPLGLFER